jgi:hypothetical protein
MGREGWKQGMQGKGARRKELEELATDPKIQRS